MTSRIMSVTAKGILGVLGLILAVGALFLFRLWLGPIEVGFLTPHLEAAVSGERTGRRLEIDDTVVAWDAETHSIDLLARGVRVLEGDGAKLAVLPEVAVRLDIGALLDGILAPTEIEILAAQLTLVRGVDGEILLGEDVVSGGADAAPEEAATEGELSRIIADLVGDLISEPDPLEPLTFLNEVRVRDGAILVEDRQFGVTWRGVGLDMSLRRALGGLTGNLQFQVALLDRFTTLKADLSYNQSFDRLGLTVFFFDLWPPALAAAVPELEVLTAVDVALNGSVIGSLDLRGRLRDLGFELSGGPGTLWHPAVFAKPQPISRLSAQGYLDLANGSLRVDQASLALEGDEGARPSLRLQGQAEGLRGDLTAKGQVTVNALPVRDLQRFWPPGADDEAGQWLFENLVAGTLERVSVGLEMVAPKGEFDHAVITSLGGQLSYEGIELHYRRPLPPVTGITGAGTFSPKRLHLDFAEARVAGLTLVDGTADLTGLDRDQASVSLKFGAAGDLGDVLGLLNNPELNLLAGSGIDPSLARGEALARVAVSFPLAADISPAAMTMEVQGRLENGSIGKVLLGQDMERGQLDLTLDSERLDLKGTLDFAGIPIALELSERLGARGPWKRRVEVSARGVDSARLASFGVDPGDRVKGPLSLDMSATFAPDGKGIVNALVDLGEATISLPAVDWHKARGVSGHAAAVVELVDDRPSAVTKLEVQAGTLAFAGQARFDHSGQTLESAGFDRISFGPDRELRDISVDARQGRAGWELIRIRGAALDRTGARQDFALHYGPAATGIYELSARAADLGTTLRVLGLHDGLAGGRLTLEGRGERPGPASPILATLDLQDLTLMDAPVVAQVLAGTSFSGWRNLLGDGVTFERLWGDLRLEDSTVSTASLRAVGGSLGLTARGQVDLDSGSLAVSGLVVPAYELNEILGQIPWLGEILVGAEGEGLVAVSYDVGGTLSDPIVSVDAATALAPGILRRVFGLEP